MDEHGAFDLAVEAKVRESFGETVEGALATVERRLEGLRSSKGVLRIQFRSFVGTTWAQRLLMKM